MNVNLEGRVALVTGGNSGIGQAIALALAEAGAKTIITGRRAEALEETARAHANLHPVVADVRTRAAAQSAIEQAISIGGRLDVLVNNAGIFALTPLESATEDDITGLYATNVFGLTYITQAALPYLTDAQGSIIHIGSTVGHQPGPGYSHYAATKAVVESLTRSWAVELAPKKVRVNCVAPGPVDTPIFGASLPAEMVEGAKQQMASGTLVGRLGTPAEIAYWVLALADPDVTWVTGQIFSIDGGMGLK